MNHQVKNHALSFEALQPGISLSQAVVATISATFAMRARATAFAAPVIGFRAAATRVGLARMQVARPPHQSQ